MKRTKIKLITLTPANGTAGLSQRDEKTVWAEVSDIGVTTKAAALSVGKNVEIQAIIFRSEYSFQTHAEIFSTLYKIIQTGAAANPLQIKLLLERQG